MWWLRDRHTNTHCENRGLAVLGAIGGVVVVVLFNQSSFCRACWIVICRWTFFVALFNQSIMFFHFALAQGVLDRLAASFAPSQGGDQEEEIR